MFTQLLTTAAALLLLGWDQVNADYISHAALINSVDHIGASWGTLVITVQLEYQSVTGIVCDDYMTDDTAEFLCQVAGFGGLDHWSRNRATPTENKMSYSDWNDLFESRFALDDLRCPAGVQRLGDCSHLLVGSHNCGYGEGLVLRCGDEARGVDLDDMEIQMQKGNGVMSSNGTVVLNGTRSSGLVCADGVDQHTAKVLCNKAGYDYLVDYRAAKNVSSSNKLNCDTMQDRNISVIAEDLDCTSNSTDLGNCTASKASGDCDVDDALWLSCTNVGGPVWELTNLTLAHNEAGKHQEWDLRSGSRFGTVLVTVRNTKSGEERTGFAPYTSSSYTRSSICYMTGYPSTDPNSKRTGGVSDSSNTKVSCGFILEHDIKFVLSKLWCPGYFESLSSCEFELIEDGYTGYPTNNDAMWVDC